MLASGLDGVKNRMDAGEPVDRNIFKMSEREKRRLRIDQLPANLSEALDNLEKDEVVTDALGEHILSHFLEAKRGEWAEYHLAGPAVGDREVPGNVLRVVSWVVGMI